MKKIILLSTVFFCCLQFTIFCSNAQILYGTTPKGGTDGAGALIKFMPADNTLSVVKSFEAFAANPYGSLVQASNGKLYGTTSSGGMNGVGVIFSYDPLSSTYTKLKDFDGANGAFPSGGNLIQASDGRLYGTTRAGGSNDAGVIFSFDPSSSTYIKLTDFDETNGLSPNSLVQASDGKLYGTTLLGGSRYVGQEYVGYGVIFSFDPSSSTYAKLMDFNRANGENPSGNLIQASDGKLYGVTTFGGSNNVGVIFSFDPFSLNYTKVRDFSRDANGSYHPFNSLFQATDGKLYGTTQNGVNDYGAIFSYNILSSKYTKLKDFDFTNGAFPAGGLMQASDGKLYGMARQGGSNDAGVIFSFDPFSSTYTKLKDFDGTNGTWPFGSLIQASDGKLYGMTSQGGGIFSFDPPAHIYEVLKVFGSSEAGNDVSANLVQAADGKLYGTTSGGGSSAYGVIFCFDLSSSTYTKLKDFNGNDGASPEGSLMQARDGKLYGMTNAGGGSGHGVIFSFDPSSSTYTKLKDFNYANGSSPHGNLMQAKDGKLYGMTGRGGSNDLGVIFSYDPSSSTYTKLKDLIDGSFPQGALMQASDGKLYGTTSSGGINSAGTIFSFDPISLKYIILKRFDNGNGANPFGSLIQASNGKLYGMTALGGSNGVGVIFSYDPSSSTYTKLKNFDNTNGAYPYGSLMQASDGKLYGMTNAGGSSNFGVIFSFDPSSSTYRKLKDYDGVNGAYPYVGSAFIEVKESNNAPTVKITSPVNGATYAALATILLSADASDPDGKVKTVSFYNGDKLIFTEDWPPFYRNWYHVPVGDYSITARATDNDGNVTTSAAVHVSVVPNKPPTVNITSPANGAIYTALAAIPLGADAHDPDGKVKTVAFYNGSTLIFTEDWPPFYRKWLHVPAGNYSITARATDDKGKTTTSAPIVISVEAASVPVARASTSNFANQPLSLNVNPNPATGILNISAYGLQTSKKSTISVLSVSGAVMKTIQAKALSKNVRMDISPLSAGVYFIKIVNGDKVLYKQFVKL